MRCQLARPCSVIPLAGGAEHHIVIAALDDAGGGDERELRVLLKIGDRGHAAVAHGGFDLIKATRDIILQRACVGDIGIHALLKGKTRLAADVVALPVARAVRALAPVFLDIHAVDKELIRGRFVKAGEVAAEHQKVRAHGEGERHVIVVDDAAVGADGNIDARFAEIFVARGGDLDERGRLTAADALRFARDADGTAADADLDKVCAALGEEAEAVAVDHIARADLHGIAVVLTHEVNDLLLPDRVALGRVNAENIRARLNERGDALVVVAGVDARADQIALLRVLEGEGVLLVLGVVLAENEVAQAVVLIHNGQSVELVLPNDVVGLLERGGGGSSDELFSRRHKIAHLEVCAHAADAVVTARDDAEEFPVGHGVLSDGDGGEAVFLLEREHIGQRVLRREIRGADDEARLAALHAAHHLRLAFDGLRAEDERKPALLGKRDGERIVRHRLHDRRDHRDIQADGAVLLPLAVFDQRRFERNAVGHALLRGVARYEQVLAEGMRRIGIVIGHDLPSYFLK